MRGSGCVAQTCGIALRRGLGRMEMDEVFLRMGNVVVF